MVAVRERGGFVDDKHTAFVEWVVASVNFGDHRGNGPGLNGTRFSEHIGGGPGDVAPMGWYPLTSHARQATATLAVFPVPAGPTPRPN